MNPLKLVLSKLECYKPSGKGYVAKCPAHEDNKPSLSIAEGNDGRALVTCFAGCTFEAIVAALELTPRDLMPDGFGGFPATDFSKPKPKSEQRFTTVAEGIRAYERSLGTHSKQWQYHNANGELVGVVVRWNRSDGGKEIRPVSLHGTEWRLEAMPSPRPLYQLREVQNADTIIVCEGEKVADAARALGLTATTSPGGSNAAEHADWKPLAGKSVLLLRDYDAPGKKYADVVARLATNSGATVKLLDPLKVFGRTELPEGYDLADAVAECSTDDERVALRERIMMVADDTETWQPSQQEETKPTNSSTQRNGYRYELDIIRGSDVRPKSVSWLWKWRIPLGAVSLVVGRPGVGKSYFTCDAAARVTTGSCWPDGDFPPEGDVLIVSAEDDPETTIVPRLSAVGANKERVFIVRALKVIAPDGKEKVVCFDLSNVDLIRDMLKRHPNIRLIVIDPIGSYLGGRVDAYRDNEVREVLAPLCLLAQDFQLAVVLVCHPPKNEVRFADDGILGSRAFSGLARSVLHICHDEQDRKRRLLLPGKSNWGEEAPGLAYRITGNPARVEWEPTPLDGMHADDALATNREGLGQRGPVPDTRNTAKEWLCDLLGDGPVLVSIIKEQADDAGFSWGTIRRAQTELGIHPRKQSYSGQWIWTLPPEAEQDG